MVCEWFGGGVAARFRTHLHERFGEEFKELTGERALRPDSWRSIFTALYVYNRKTFHGIMGRVMPATQRKIIKIV